MPRTSSSSSSTVPECGCGRCRCRRHLRCRCHDLNALIALVLWDLAQEQRNSRPRR